jgi:hypothetical protein
LGLERILPPLGEGRNAAAPPKRKRKKVDKSVDFENPSSPGFRNIAYPASSFRNYLK